MLKKIKYYLLSNKKLKCDICYIKKNVENIKCCIGKKWCKDCKLKIKNKKFPRCPYCRNVLKTIKKENIKNPCLNNSQEILNSPPIPVINFHR
jgi:hypothetical protein